ncbi:MAG: PepSY domain-containing protein [Candidatus Odinarchaeota archaeon]
MNKKTAYLFVGFIAAVFSLGMIGVLGHTGVADRIIIGDDDEAYHAGDAVITAGEAKAIAENYTGGTATSVELENEDGYLVYGVIVETGTGCLDVKVDAGTGEVMKVDPDD